MIRIKNISKSFGELFVLNNLSCEINTSGMNILLGPSGAGKSTLMRCINRLEKIDEGSIEVFGNQVPDGRKALIKFRKDIAMIFQHFNLINQMSVLDNVLVGTLNGKSFFSSLCKKFKKEEIEIAKNYLNRVGLYEKRFCRVSELSGGQQQRVSIARALMQNPKLILADEPIASLDPKTATDIMELLSQITNEEKIGVLVTLHQVDYAKRYGDHIIGIDKGKVILDESNDKLTVEEILKLYGIKGVSFDE